MLASDSEIHCEMLYMGPGNGCRHVVRCDAIGFVKELDCLDLSKSMNEAIRQLDDIIFNAFLAGDYFFKAPGQHEKATKCISLPNIDLIDLMYHKDCFIAEIVRRELIRREIWDDDIYQIGKFGNDLAQSQAISIMKSKDRLG